MQCSSFFPRRYLALSRPASTHNRRKAVRTRAKKGFGSKLEDRPSDKKNASKGSIKQTKRRLQQPSNPMAPSQPSPNSREAQFLQKMERMQEGKVQDDIDFEKRLQQLQKRGEGQQAQQMRAPSRPEGGVLNASPPAVVPSAGPSQGRAAKQKNQEASVVGSFGVPQIAVGGISLILVAVFLLTSGFGPGGDPVSQTSSQEKQISAEEEKALQERAKELDEKLKANPKDLAALRESTSLAAALGDLKKFRDLAEQLTKAEAQDFQTWLALADARIRQADYKGAAEAYQKSLDVSGKPALEQLQGLAAALVTDKRPGVAVQKLQSYEGQAGMSGAVGAVELQLLIGKVYSQWDRHFASALAVYDGLIDKYPDDFRGYLARGALLKENGRKADAQRMFIKARFLAPPEARAVVDNVSNR